MDWKVDDGGAMGGEDELKAEITRKRGLAVGRAVQHLVLTVIRSVKSESLWTDAGREHQPE